MQTINPLVWKGEHHVAEMLLTGSRPEDDLMGLASGPWGVEYRLWALCSAAAVLPICVKYPTGTACMGGLDSPVLKKSLLFTPPDDKTFIFCWEASATAGRAAAGETPLGTRIIFPRKVDWSGGEKQPARRSPAGFRGQKMIYRLKLNRKR